MKFTRNAWIYGLVFACAVYANGAGAAGKLDDAAIFALFDQANTTDIWTSRLGMKYGHSDQVRTLGRMVATDHEAVQQMGRELARKLGMVAAPPADDTSAESLSSTVAMLQSKSGAEFDAAYLRHEIAFHQSVIDAIKGALLPAVENAELRALIETVLPGFEHHLAATKEVADRLGIRQIRGN